MVSVDVKHHVYLLTMINTAIKPGKIQSHTVGTVLEVCVHFECLCHCGYSCVPTVVVTLSEKNHDFFLFFFFVHYV